MFRRPRLKTNEKTQKQPKPGITCNQRKKKKALSLQWELPHNSTVSRLERRNDQEGALQFVVDCHHRGVVVKLATVVRRGEHRHKLATREEAVPPLHHLVRTHDEVHVHHVQEIVHDVFTKQVAHAAVALQEALHVVLRISPQQITQDATVRHIARTINI